MNAAAWACASSGVTWDGISWADVQRQVRRLQARIVKATQVGRYNKVKAVRHIVKRTEGGSDAASNLRLHHLDCRGNQ